MFFSKLKTAVLNFFLGLPGQKNFLRWMIASIIAVPTLAIALILAVTFFSSREHVYLLTTDDLYEHDYVVSETNRPVRRLASGTNVADINLIAAQYAHDNLAAADFQYDFEHLMRVLEADWPFFELSISANGVDVHQLANEFRYTLAEADVDAIGFFELLREEFFRPIGQLGHLWVVNYPMFFSNSLAWNAQRIREANYHGGVTPLARHNSELVRHLPSIILYNSLRDAGIGSLPDMEELEPTYETHILSDDTALLSVRRMLHLDDALVWQPGRLHRDYYAEQLYDFWYEIKDFDHLIIDLRGNLGGHICHFSKYVASILITSRTWLPAYVFFGDGYYSNIGRSVSSRTVGNYINAWPEPVFHIDTGNLDFVFRSAASWLPASFYRAWGYAFFAEHREPFAGKVWVLTNERTASGAEAVTAMLSLNNLATVIGQPTWGVFGTAFDREGMAFALPNTGVQIRIDTAIYKCHEGNYLQGYGLQPHYAPRYGMDALETVLAMIAEGAY